MLDQRTRALSPILAIGQVSHASGHHMDTVDYIRYVAALVFVIAALFGFSFLLRRLGGGRFGMVAVPRAEKRLKLLEIMPLDARRRLILIGHDDREHLILLGHERDLVIEAGRSGQSTSAPVAGKNFKATLDEVDNGPSRTSRYIPASRGTDEN